MSQVTPEASGRFLPFLPDLQKQIASVRQEWHAWENSSEAEVGLTEQEAEDLDQVVLLLHPEFPDITGQQLRSAIVAAAFTSGIVAELSHAQGGAQ